MTATQSGAMTATQSGASAAASSAAPERWERVRVIWNPNAGTKPGIAAPAATEAQMRSLMAAAGLGDELHATESAGEARALAKGAVRDAYQLVVAAGGDGTIGTVATELLGSQTALGILPLGSVMNVARSLGLPRELDAAAEVLASGVVRAMDVGHAGDRVFFEAASVGMNAAMFKEAQRFDRGDWTSILRTVWVAIRYRPARMEIRLDDRILRTRALMVVIANGPFTGLALTVAPRARLDDGRFDVVVFRRFSKVRLLRHLAGIAFGRVQPTPPETDVHRSERVAIRSAHPLPARADSHDLGTTPVELRVDRAALRVVVSDR
jgi:diacylglycerol kinase (ATP)